VYRALLRAQISPGQRLAIFGIGGLGHVAVQIAQHLGAEITAVDICEDKLELARSLGAVSALNAASPTVVKEIRSKGGVHFALVTSAAKAAYDMAFSCLRPTGTLLVVGLPSQDLCFPAMVMAGAEVRIQATAVGTRKDLREVLALAGDGKIRCHVNTHPLEDSNEALEQLRHGRVSGRLVLTFP
jgi:propanol-preferring alcohol dehydrogenase